MQLDLDFTIFTSEYDENEKKIVAKNFINSNSELKGLNFQYLIPEEFFEFIKEYKEIFKTNLSFLYIIKILSFYKKIIEHKKEHKIFDLILAIYFALYSNFDKKNQRKNLLEILIKLNEEIKIGIDELVNLSLKNNESKNPLDIQENILISKFTGIKIEFTKNNDYLNFEENEIIDEKIKQNKNMEGNISFITPFNKLINYIHFSLALNIPLIIEGQIGIGKKTAIRYLANILKLKEIYFSLSNTTTVEDLFCKTIPIQSEKGLEFKESRSRFLDAIDSSKYKTLENCIIIIDNLQEASNNILESLIPVFDETKDKIFLPNGEIVSKRKFHIIAIYDQTSKGTNIKNFLPNSIKNSSLIFKCEQFLEEKNILNIGKKILEDKIDNYENFINDFIEIYNYCQNNHKKELFNFNDFTKYKKISQINLTQSKNKNIIDNEILHQIILLYRFTNLYDVKLISSKMGHLLTNDLWPQIEYTNKINNKISNYIKTHPTEPKEKEEKDKFLVTK